MKLCLIADAFPPMRTSAAVQLRDLSRDFVRQGHELTVISPTPELEVRFELKRLDGHQLLRVRSPQTKDVGFLKRTLGELLTPFLMLISIRKSSIKNETWDGIIWYSPSIFKGPLVKFMKIKKGGKRYLIIRDIFPEWAVDLGLMKRGIPYHFFNGIALYQYSLADIIGVQSPGNLRYFSNWAKKSGRQLETLQNWLSDITDIKCSLNLDKTPLAGRKLFVYAGNMGVAQNMDILLNLAVKLRSNLNVGFLFVGRGTELVRLKQKSEELKLDNVLFENEVHPDEIPDLYRQCDIGLVSLDPRHKTHNIPGKFLSYLQAGLPVLANVNAGNDISNIISVERVGFASELNDVNDLQHLAEKLISQIEKDPDLSRRCIALFKRDFTAEKAVTQIASALGTVQRTPVKVKALHNNNVIGTKADDY